MVKPLKSLVFLALSVAATPAGAEDRTPESLLYALKDSRDWRIERAAWDNAGYGRRSQYDWILKITYGVRKDGRLMNCSIDSPSGFDAFDKAACETLLANARVEPAKNAVGQAVRSSGEVYLKMRHQAWICATGLDEEE